MEVLTPTAQLHKSVEETPEELGKSSARVFRKKGSDGVGCVTVRTCMEEMEEKRFLSELRI